MSASSWNLSGDLQSSDSHRELTEQLRGRYDITRVLGSGGMATVFLAQDVRHGRSVALKVMRPEIMSPTVKARFTREIGYAARLSHPHILQLYDSGEAAGTLFYVMPLADGDSLRARMNRDGAFAIDEVLRIASQVAAALDHAHSEGVVHRDLKPENILLHRGEALVADFGIALAVGSDRRLTTEGFSLGTPDYMSPEQAAGEIDIDGRADIYSLGCVVFEMLTGHRPFTGSSAQAVMAKRFIEPTPMANRSRAEVPIAVAQAVRRAMELRPESRFSTAGAFAKAIMVQPMAAHTKSVAVLPFLNLTADPDNEYFADGIAEDVIAQLAKIRSLKVISRGSVSPFKKRENTIAEIAAALGVTSVLDGSVRRAGNRVRIVAQLIDPTSSENVWVETYDRDLTDIFAIQSDVALQIATALKAELSTDERIRIRREPTRNLEAYQLYVQGRFWFGRFTTEGGRRAIKYFQDAVDLDPEFAGAYAALALVYSESMVSFENMDIPAADAFEKAFVYASRALELDASSGDAHAVLGIIKLMRDLDWSGAEAEFQRALELSPGSADAYDHYAWLCGSIERYDDAVSLARRAKELDPLTHVTDLSSMLLRAGRYEEAIEEGKRNVDFDPRMPRARSALGWAYIFVGRTSEGLAELEKAVALSSQDNMMFQGQLGLAYAMSGRTDESRAILLKMLDRAKTRYVSPSNLAYIYLGLGDDESAMDQLEASYNQRTGNFYGIKGSFLFRPLRSHPRFIALLQKMNLA